MTPYYDQNLRNTTRCTVLTRVECTHASESAPFTVFLSSAFDRRRLELFVRFLAIKCTLPFDYFIISHRARCP